MKYNSLQNISIDIDDSFFWGHFFVVVWFGLWYLMCPIVRLTDFHFPTTPWCPVFPSEAWRRLLGLPPHHRNDFSVLPPVGLELLHHKAPVAQPWTAKQKLLCRPLEDFSPIWWREKDRGIAYQLQHSISSLFWVNHAAERLSKNRALRLFLTVYTYHCAIAFSLSCQSFGKSFIQMRGFLVEQHLVLNVDS